MGHAPSSVCLPALVFAPWVKKEVTVSSVSGEVTVDGRFAKPVRLAFPRHVYSGLSLVVEKMKLPCHWREQSPTSSSMWHSVQLR
uniref:Uncharacterized protein n=1 Tax=Arundo donax TaxID=35708 RepID=A0A0A8Z0H8_ARUDO